MSDLRATNFKGRTSGSVPNMPDGVVVGSAVTISSSGIDVGAAGIITATSFSGGTTGDFSIEDSFVHTGDTNTAIRFPAADTFTVETGGTERFRVDSGGDVGIGTATVDNTLHVYKSGDGQTQSSLKLVMELRVNYVFIMTVMVGRLTLEVI